MKQLSEKAVIVNLRIAQWTASKLDKQVTKKIEKEHNARNAGRFTKKLITPEELKAIQLIVGQTRTLLYDRTLPWGDNGDRLLPATTILRFKQEYESLKTKFELAVEAFIRKYPALKMDAKSRLNGMFVESDYPEMERIRSKFNMVTTYMPMPDSNDFRVEVDAEEVETMRRNMQEEINLRMYEATKNIWERIKEAVEHMAERLSDKNNKFKDSLVNNIQDLISILPQLNITNDPHIHEATESMKSLVVRPTQLRTNRIIRQQKATEAKAILNNFSRMFA